MFPYLKRYINYLMISVLSMMNSNLFAQAFEKPNFSSTSHPTLELERIETLSSQTMVYMSITNQRISGSFCVSDETYIRNSLGPEEYKLQQSMGIPDCPDEYKFTSVGEKVSFILVFPAIDPELKYIDIVEDCEEACFTITYVLLDKDLNEIINRGFRLYEQGNLNEALKVFEDMMAVYNDRISPVFGTVYLYLMSIHYELGNSDEIKILHEELKQSAIINKEEIIEAAWLEGLIR